MKMPRIRRHSCRDHVVKRRSKTTRAMRLVCSVCSRRVRLKPDEVLVTQDAWRNRGVHG